MERVIYKNIEFFGVSEHIQEEDGSVSWYRFPRAVHDALEEGKEADTNATGVELRFVLLSDLVRLRFAERAPGSASVTFRVFRGGIQGGWQDSEGGLFISPGRDTVEIKKAENPDMLRRMSEHAREAFSPEVIRVIPEGKCRLVDVEGDVLPPPPELCPAKKIWFYGSSITHGSIAMCAAQKFVSVIGHTLRMDARNFGMPGTCRLEGEIADFFAREGRAGAYDVLHLELGINVLDFSQEKARARSEYFLRTVARANPDKPIFVTSPFYCFEDFNGGDRAEMWRRVLRETVASLGCPNVYYTDGTDILGDMSLISADEVHPNVYGVAQIADRLGKRIGEIVKWEK